MTTKTRIKYYGSIMKWTRRQCVDWIKKQKCPECTTVGRFYPGTDYDRFKVHCLNCGARFAFKPPKEAL